MSGNMFRGASADQDSRFADKEKKLIRTMKFPSSYDQKVDIKRVEMGAIKHWVQETVKRILGMEDDVIVDFIFNSLEDTSSTDKLNPRSMQINLTGFLGPKTPGFMKELWELLVSAQDAPGGVPPKLVIERAGQIQRLKEERESTQRHIKAFSSNTPNNTSMHPDRRMIKESHGDDRSSPHKFASDRRYRERNGDGERRRSRSPKHHHRDKHRHHYRSHRTRSQSRERYSRRSRSRSKERSRHHASRSRSGERDRRHASRSRSRSRERSHRRRRHRSRSGSHERHRHRVRRKRRPSEEDRRRANRAENDDTSTALPTTTVNDNAPTVESQVMDQRSDEEERLRQNALSAMGLQENPNGTS